MAVSDGNKLERGAASPPSHNLPVPPTPLIGRQNEVATAANLRRREDVRFVTLTGPPGIGKTRLSIEIAKRLITDFAHGVYFINLVLSQSEIDG